MAKTEPMETEMQTAPGKPGQHLDPMSSQGLKTAMRMLRVRTGEFAKILGIDKSRISRWRTGKVTIPSWLEWGVAASLDAQALREENAMLREMVRNAPLDRDHQE